MKAWLAALTLSLMMASPASALPSKVQVVALSLSPKDQAKPLQDALERELKDSRRFVMAKAITVQGVDSNPMAALPGLRRATKADLVFAGTVTVAKEGDLALDGRIYDLAIEDVSKQIRFTGHRNDIPALARELARFIRSRSPLRGEITGMRDNRVLINLGSEDGVEPGTYFVISRANATRGAQVGQLRIISTDAWFSTGEVMSRQRGGKVTPGDSVLEDVGYSLIDH